MPGHCPAIVESPHHAAAGAAQIAEKELGIDVIAVKIVQMDHIGGESLKPADELPGGTPGKKAIVVGNACRGSIKPHPGMRANAIAIDTTEHIATRSSHKTFVSCSTRGSHYSAHHMSGAATAEECVDVSYSHIEMIFLIMGFVGRVGQVGQELLLPLII